MNSTEQKVIKGLIAFWSDSCSIRGKPVNREIRRAIKAKAGSRAWKVISSSPSEVQFYAAYADTPLRPRRKWLDTIYYTIIAELALYDPALRLFFLALWHMTEGVKQVKLREIFTQWVGAELSEVIWEQITAELGMDKALKLDASTLGLQPSSIAGANTRLRSVLQERSVKEGQHKSYYEQDLSIGLWETSEGKHLDEFAKALSSNPTEAATNLRRILKEKDSKEIRGVVLRILRKTIEDLPDIHQEVRKLEVQSRELPLTEEVSAAVASKYGDLVEPSPADLLEQIGISRDNTSEAEWQVFMMLSQKILDGELEVGSKTGLSISAALGKDAPRVRKIISRYRERQLNR